MNHIEEGSEVQENGEEEEEERVFYKFEDIYTPPRTSDRFPLDRPSLELHHSFGYDCFKRGNIQMLNKHTVVYASGNFVHYMDVNTKAKTFKRTMGCCGIGHIMLHPSANHLAVAEKGVNPKIYIYDAATLNVWKILRGGADLRYAFITFDPSGKLLASLASEPDYTLTVWNWKAELIILRSRAFYNDVNIVAFSPFTSGFLTTGGTGHIKFWKMAKTFTGLKLQGILGRFGRTEVSSIEGVLQFPDGKVLSGSEWGNMLIWDVDLIKVELTRRMGKLCHTAAIMQFLFEEGEILSVGCDGYIKVWQFEIIDAADSLDGKGFFELEPLNELRVGTDVHLMYIVKSLDETTPNFWFAQDRNGGIWKLDLSFSHTSKPPEKILSCHSGAIKGMDVSPLSHLVATTGVDGFVRLYDILEKTLLCERRFQNGGSCVAWIPHELNSRGDLFAVGFTDGIIRLLGIQQAINNLNEPYVKLVIYDCLRPHTKQITGIAYHVETQFLVTGSDDCTIFMFSWTNMLNPIGFVTLPGKISSITCSAIGVHPNSVFATCASGQIVRLSIPKMDTKFLTTISRKKSFSLLEECPFTVVEAIDLKNHIKREAIRIAKEKLKKEKAAKGEEEEEEEEEDEEDEDAPPIPTRAIAPILFGFCGHKPNTFWISMGAPETGYLYEYAVLNEPEENYPFSPFPASVFALETIDLTPVHCFEMSPNGHFVVMGMKDGTIYVIKLRTPWVMSSIEYYWGDRMHDFDYGDVTKIRFTYDQKFLLSVGNDGNMFSFVFDSASIPRGKAVLPEERDIDDEFIEVNDISDPEFPSLEEERHKQEHNKLMKLVEKKKMILLTNIRTLTNEFIRLVQSNTALPTIMQLKKEALLPNKTLRKELMNEFAEMEKQTKAELAWEAEKYTLSLNKLQSRFKNNIKWEVLKVKTFSGRATVSTYRLTYLNGDVTQELYLDKEIQRLDSKVVKDSVTEPKPDKLLKIQEIALEKQIVRRVSDVFDLNIHVQRVLKRIEARKQKRADRTEEWEKLKSRKPNENKGDPAVQKALEDARNNQGDYNLKSAPDYVVADHMRMTTKKKLKELVASLLLTFEYKEEFNQKVLDLRNDKKNIIKRIEWIADRIGTTQKTMQVEERKPIPIVPQMDAFEIPEDILNNDLAKLVPSTDSTSTVGSGSDKPTTKMPGMSRFRVSVVSAMLPASRARASIMLGRSPMAQTSRPSAMENEFADNSDVDLHSALQTKMGLSPLEERIQKMILRRNLYDQDKLILEAEHLKKEFDERVVLLIQEKYRLEVALKLGSCRQLVLYNELQLLAQFETEEEEMIANINQATNERNDLQMRVQDLQGKIETRKREAEKMREQEKILQQELIMLLGEHNKFGNFLTKVYKKKMKRVKKKIGEKGEEEEESSESDDDLDEIDAEEDEDDEFIDDRQCPEGCDKQLFTDVLDLRERRLDIEEVLSEIRKYNEALRKDTDALNKKLKSTLASLQASQMEFKKVQQEKQSRLNEIFTLAPLKLNQLQYTVNGELPADLSGCLVFPSNTLKKLEDRIRELQQERVIQRQNFRKSKLHHTRLVKECKFMDDKIELLQKKCHELMIEKFGCVVDLEKIESYAVNRAVEEMKEKLKSYKTKFEWESLQWKKKTEELEMEITKEIFNNTQRILGINEAMTELQAMEAKFMIRQKSLPLDLLPEKTPRQVEQDRIQQLVQCQEEEIEYLQQKLSRAQSKSFCPSRELQNVEDWVCRTERQPKYDEEISDMDEKFDMNQFLEELFAADASEEDYTPFILDETDSLQYETLELDLPPEPTPSVVSEAEPSTSVVILDEDAVEEPLSDEDEDEDADEDEQEGKK